MRPEDAGRSDRRIAGPEHPVAIGDACTRPHRRRHLVLVAFVIGLIALWAGPAAAQGNGSESLSSQINGQINTASFRTDANFASSFNDSFGTGDTFYNSTLGTGVEFGGNISGTFGLDLQVTTGTDFSPTIGYSPNVGFSLYQANGTTAASTIVSSNTSNNCGNNCTPTSYVLKIANNTPTATLTLPPGATGPTLGFSLGLLTAASASLNGSACIFGSCTSGSTTLFNYNNATPGSATSPGDALPIISYNNTSGFNSGTLSLFGTTNIPLKNGVAASPGALKLSYDPTAGIVGVYLNGQVLNELPDSEDFVKNVGPQIELGSIGLNPSLVTQTAPASNELQSYQPQFLSVSADLIGLLSAALHLPINPLQPQFSLGGLFVSTNLLSVSQGLNMGVTDTVAFNPSLGVTLQTSVPVEWSQNGTPQTGLTTSFTTSDLSDPITITTQSQTDVALLPTVTPSGTLTDSLAENFNGTLTVSGPSFGVSYDHIPLYSTPPVTGSPFGTYNEGSIGQHTSQTETQIVPSSLLPGIQGSSISTDPAKIVNVDTPNTVFNGQLTGNVTVGNVSGTLQVASGSNAMNSTALTIQPGGTMELCPSTASCTPLPTGESPGPVKFDTPTLTVGTGSPGGTLLVDSGATINITGATSSTNGFTNASGILAGQGTLQGGTFVIAGTLNYQGNDITYIDPGTSLTLNGSGTLQNGTFNGTSFSNGHNALQSLESNDGTLVVGSGATLTTSVTYNSGTLQVAGTFATRVFENLSGGLVQVNGGVLNVTGGGGFFFNMDNGTLSGGSYDIETGTIVAAGSGSQITSIGSGTSVTLGGPKAGFFFATTTSQNNFSNDNLSYLTSNNGTLTLQSGAQQYLFASGTPSTGLATVYGSGNIVQTFTNNGSLNILPGTSSNNQGCGSSQSCLWVSGNFVNASGGTLTINGGGLNVALVDPDATGTVDFTNNGTLNLTNNGDYQGTLNVSGLLGNLNSCGSSGCTLSGGTWNIGSTLAYDTSYNGETGDTVIREIGSTTTFTLAGGTISGGLDSLVENDGTLNIQYETVGTTRGANFSTNKGALTLTEPGGGLVTSSSLSNTGTISIGQSANLYVGLTPNSDNPNSPTYHGQWSSFSNGTLSNIGNITVTGQLDYDGSGAITTLAGGTNGSNLTLDGSNSALRLMYYNSNGASGDALTGHLQIVASGATLNLTNGYTFEVQTPLTLSSGSTFTTDSASYLLIDDSKSVTIMPGATVGNAGSILLNGTSAGAILAFGSGNASGNVMLSGGGSVLMSANANNAITTSSGVTLVNVDNTITGSGTISGNLTNQGTIDASGPVALTIINPYGGAITNTGMLGSIGSGTTTTYADGMPLQYDSNGDVLCENSANCASAGTIPTNLVTTYTPTGTVTTYADGTAVQYNSSGQPLCENQANCTGIPTNIVTATQPSTLVLSGVTVNNFSGASQGTISAQSIVELTNSSVLGGIVNVGSGSVTAGGGSIGGGIGGMLQLNGASVTGGTLTNAGTITTVGTTSNTLGGTINNQVDALIQVSAGSTLNVQSTATFSNNGELDLVPGASASSPTQLLGGSISNAGSIEASDQAGYVSITTAIANTASGAFNVDNGAAVSYTGSLSNAGQLTVGGSNGSNSASSKLSVSGSITQTGGSTVVTAGSLSFGSFALDGGTMLLQSTNGTTGAVTVNGGTMQIAANQSLGAALVLQSGSITGGTNTSGTSVVGSLTATSIDLQSGSVSAILAGSEAITKDTSGTVVLSGANTFTSSLAINGGVLQISAANNLGAGSSVGFAGGTLEATTAGFSISKAIALNSGGGTIQSDSGALTLAGAITGTHGLTIAGVGTVALAIGVTLPATALSVSGNFQINGTNQSVGAVTLAGGTIASSGGTLSGTSYSLQSGTISAALAGTGALTMAGPGTAILSGTNTYSGGTTVTSGILQLGANGTLLSTGAVAVNGGTFDVHGFTQTIGNLSGTGGFLALGGGTLTAGTGNSTTLGSQIAGAGTLVKQGAGTLTLTATNNNGAAFNTTVNAGTLSIGAAGDLGAGALTLAGGTLAVTGATTLNNAVSLGTGGGTIDNSAALTLIGGITGSGGFTQAGSATTILNHVGNSFSGGTTVTSGTLQLGAGGVLSSTGAVTANGGTFDVHGFTQVIGDLSGTGGTVSLGAGSLFVGGANADTLASQITGTGTLTMQGSGSLALTNTNNSAASFRTAVNSGTVRIGAAGDLGTGTLTLGGGTLEVTSGSFTLGNSVIVNGTGGTVQTDSGTALTLSQSINAGGTLFTKTGAGTLALGGANNLDNTAINGGVLQISAVNNLASNGGGVSLGGGTLEVTSGSFTLGQLVTLTTSSDTIETDSGVVLKQGQPIIGSGTLNKTGAGTLSLAGNSYTGGTAIDAGTVQIAASNALGNGGTVTLGGGTLEVTTGSFTLAHAIALNAGTDTVQVDSGASATLSQSISGGALTKTGTGTLILDASNGYTGGTAIDAGVVRFNAANQLGTGTIGLAGGTLDQNGGTPALGNAIALNTGGGTIQSDNSTLTLNGTITGTGGLTIAGGGIVALGSGVALPATALTVSGRFQIDDTNETVGAVTLNGGTISSSNGGTLSGSSVDLQSGTVSAILAGTGAVTKDTSGTVTLSGANTYSGGTTVTAGTLVLGANNVLAAAGALAVNGGTFNVSGRTQTIGDLSGSGGTLALGTGSLTEGTGNNTSLASQVTGNGTLLKQGGGTLILSNSSNGGAAFKTTVNAGTISVGAAGDLGTGALTLAGGTLAVTGATTLSNAVSLGIGGGTIDNSAALTLSGAITGTGKLTQAGSATTTLSHIGNSFSGGTTVTSGTLQLGASFVLSTTGAVAVNGGTFDVHGFTQTVGDLSGMGGTVALGGGTLTEGTANSTTLASAITGSGTLIKAGTGTLTLSGSNAGQGFATTVNQGALAFGASNALGGGAVGVGASGTVTIAGTSQSASTISDSGAVTVGGGALTGALTINSGGLFSGFGTLNGAVTNSGLLTASGGTLRLTGAIIDPGGSVTVAPNSTLDLSGSSGASQATVLTQNGTLILNSSGMTVSQDYTNANSGTGNSFNKAANVSGAPIDATGNVAQAIVAGSGTAAGQVTNGTGSTATLSVGNVHVGSSVTANYQVANTGSSGPALRGTVQTTGNGANISDSRLSGSGISAASSFGLVGGDLGPIDAGSSTGNLSVTFTGTTAGALTGQVVHIANNFANVGEQTLDITGAAYRLATANVSPTPLSLGNFHVGGTATGSIAVANTATADGYSESLGITGVSATGTGLAASNALGNGLLAAGASDASAVGVTLSNIQAGAQSDSVTVDLDSNGTGTSGLGTTALASQGVSVSATGYRLATTHLANTTLNFGAARVGDTAPTQSLTYSNTQVADGYSEGLTVTQGTLPTAYTGGLGTSNLAAGQQTTGTLALQTTTSGNFSGQTVSLAVASTGATTSGLGDTALSDASVTLNGEVYQTAQAQATSDVDFGVVHRNQAVPTQAITVSNVATGALVDQLRGGFGAVSGPFTGSGTLAGVAGNGGTNSTSLHVGIQTGTVGGQSGTAQLTLSSHDADLSDVAVTTQSVTLQGQVNDYAKPVLTKLSGDGQFSAANNSYALNFAYRPGEDFSAELDLANVLSYADSEAAYTDSLLGSFSVVSGGGFSFSGLGPIDSLTAGGSDDDFDVAFDAAHAVDGFASEELEFNGVSHNSSGDTDLAPIFLTLIASSNVDEPDDLLVLGFGLFGLGAIRTARRRGAAARRCRPDTALDVAA
jgi:autotransporter-associated beta strand protein